MPFVLNRVNLLGPEYVAKRYEIYYLVLDWPDITDSCVAAAGREIPGFMDLMTGSSR